MEEMNGSEKGRNYRFVWPKLEIIDTFNGSVGVIGFIVWLCSRNQAGRLGRDSRV